MLAEHCERAGRPRSEIAVTKLVLVVIAPTMEEARSDVEATAAAKGWTRKAFEDRLQLRDDVVIGDPDTVGEVLQRLAGYGLDGVTADLPANAHRTERIALLGEVAHKAFPGRA